MKTVDLSGFVNPNGQPLDLMSASLKPAPKRHRDSDAKWHKGWSVQGHPPGALETAQKETETACARWRAMDAVEQASALKKGERQPRSWDELAWRETTKLQRVRSKPYEIPESAIECKRLAESSGWLDVRVLEMKRG